MRTARQTGGPKHGSGERSNAWSGSKYTNQTPYNPFDSEFQWWGHRGRPSLVVPVEGRAGLPIYDRPLHQDFVRPFDSSDVATILSMVPPAFLFELEGVFLFGGSTKQSRAADSELFHYGCYGNNRCIFLHAFPRRLLFQRRASVPKPNVQQELRRSGVTIEIRDGRCSIQFTDSSIRRFYLYNVLLHEVGHHVDRHTREGGSREGFANWFADARARDLFAAADAGSAEA